MLNRLSGIILGITLSLLYVNPVPAQTNHKSPVMIGAEVIIEPGQTDEEIDLWFERLNENGMELCRIRLFEDYLKRSVGT
jgi:beta-galactosidase